MEEVSINFLKNIYSQHKEEELFGKWITYKDILNLFEKHSIKFEINKIGESENGKPINSLKIGNGKKRILLWSQMHGNESTGTKALFDLFNCISFSNSKIIDSILKECTLLFIPMLNPDGALAYTRVNANNVDLNRDAVNRIAKESKLLRKTLEDFNPQFCFNLHDQRTIFGVEGTNKTATISFLAPSEEITRKITDGRKQTMNVIGAMNNLLKEIIPGHIGRYTDEFYPTATGDNFQKLGYNTILIESGHYPDDYDREVSRKYTFYTILTGLHYIAITNNFNNENNYFTIPNNNKIFFDVIHRVKNGQDKAFQYEDKIVSNKLLTTLVEIACNEINLKIGHKEVNC